MKKIKGSVKALHPDIIFVLFAIFTAAAIGVRAYQLMYIFEPDTGFYYIEAGNNITIPLLYALTAASCLLLLVFSFLCGKFPKENVPKGKNYFIAVSSVIFSVTLVIDAMLRFSDIFNLYDSSTASSITEFIITSKSFPQIFEIVFALIAALYFVITAVSFFSGSGSHMSARVMSLTPVCWLMCRLISRFVRAVSFLNVSELFWEIIMIVFMMIFFMGYARIMSNIESKGKLPMTVGAGLCAAMLAFMVFFSRVIAYLFAGEAYLTAESPIEFCDFGAGLCACMFLLSCVHDLSPKSETEEKSVPAAAEPIKMSERPSQDDEAFRIAEQYANRYITEDAPIIDTPAAPSVTETAPAAAEDSPKAETAEKADNAVSSENGD